MTTTRRVGRPLSKSTPRQLFRPLGQERQLPRDLLQQASSRLGIMSLVAAALWVLAPALGHVASRVPFPQTMDVVAGVNVLVSVGLFAYTRQRQGDPRFILDLGLGYMILTALALGFTAHLNPFGTTETWSNWTPEPDISWIGVVVLIFAAVVPTPHVKML